MNFEFTTRIETERVYLMTSGMLFKYMAPVYLTSS